jgi:hypothetical protein
MDHASSSDEDARREAGYSHWPARGDVAQTIGVVGGPLALLLGLQVKYTIAQMWACESGTARGLVHVAALATLLLAIGSGVAAASQWRPALRGADPGDEGGPVGRTRMMAVVGVGMSALSALVIVSQWLPQLFLDPCRQ